MTDHFYLSILLEGELITKGQGLFFLISMSLFGILIIALYRKDRSRDVNYFKGTWKVFLALIVVVTLLFMIVMSRK